MVPRSPPTAVIPREGGVSSTLRVFDSITSALEYWVPACAGTTIECNSAISRHTAPEFFKFIGPQNREGAGKTGCAPHPRSRAR